MHGLTTAQHHYNSFINQNIDTYTELYNTSTQFAINTSLYRYTHRKPIVLFSSHTMYIFTHCCWAYSFTHVNKSYRIKWCEFYCDHTRPFKYIHTYTHAYLHKYKYTYTVYKQLKNHEIRLPGLPYNLYLTIQRLSRQTFWQVYTYSLHKSNNEHTHAYIYM